MHTHSSVYGIYYPFSISDPFTFVTSSKVYLCHFLSTSRHFPPLCHPAEWELSSYPLVQAFHRLPHQGFLPRFSYGFPRLKFDLDLSRAGGTIFICLYWPGQTFVRIVRVFSLILCRREKRVSAIRIYRACDSIKAREQFLKGLIPRFIQLFLRRRTAFSLCVFFDSTPTFKVG